MLDNIKLCKYYNSVSDIHKLNPLAKLISLLIFVISMFVTKNMYFIFILFVFELIILMTSNIPFKIFLNNILSLKYLIIFIIIINIIAKITVIDTLILVVKIVAILISTNLFIYTTPPYKILESLNKLLKPFSYLGFNTQSISLMIALSIRFIPVTVEETKKIYNSLLARGLSSDSDLKEKILGLKALIFPIYLLSFRRADNLSDMMELKLYNSNSKIFSKRSKWNYLDVTYLMIHIIIVFVVIGVM